MGLGSGVKSRIRIRAAGFRVRVKNKCETNPRRSVKFQGRKRVYLGISASLQTSFPRSRTLLRLIVLVHAQGPCTSCQSGYRNVDVRLPGKDDSNSHVARPVHLIITMIKWIRTGRLSIKGSGFYSGVRL